LPKNSKKVFGDSKMDSMKSTFLNFRKKSADKHQNPKLLYITFHTLRHWKAVKLLHETKDLTYVRDFLGHKSIKNTEIYATVERGIFGENNNEGFIVKVAEKTEDVKALLEVGFEWIGTKDNLIFLRKRK
jgi:integrase